MTRILSSANPAALDDHVVVERHRAVAHRHVVVALGGALAAALRVRAGGEQEIAGKAARAGVVALGIGAVQRDRIPARLRVEAPAEMRDGVAVHVVRPRAIAVEPVAHQLGVEAAFDLADEAVADVEPHLVLHVAAIGQHDDVARLRTPRCRWRSLRSGRCGRGRRPNGRSGPALPNSRTGSWSDIRRD